LIGLPNRRLLEERIRLGIAQSRRNGKPLAVCYFDLDNFKPINGRFGPGFGDHVLVTLATHLKTVLGPEDMLARLGGDEFVIFLGHLEDMDALPDMMARIQGAISTPIITRHTMLTLTASIGVAIADEADVDADTLMRRADQAMYMAKQAGKNGYRLFDQEHDQKIQTYLFYQQRLKEALAKGEFRLHYQPKVDMSRGEMVGVEALIRWQHPERGLLSPGEFMPYLEGNDLDMAVGEWVIENVLKEKTQWDAAGMVFNVSINISPGHLLHPAFASRLQAILDRHATVDPSHVVLEILESAALSDMKHASRAATRCRELGVKIALDDFGTGYSSLTYLRNLPIDVLKIDQSFVRDMLSDPSDLAIVVSVIQLAKTFNRTVIAEGVETLEHGARLVEVGCDLMQGYGIARPMPPENIPAWFRQWHAHGAWRTLSSAAPHARPASERRFGAPARGG
jgi:diguanylate cyclase (GGDEF)-like protein